PPVRTHGVCGAALPTGMSCTSSPTAAELAMPSGPVSITISPPPPHALPTAISWRSSPAAAVLAIRPGPQRISSEKGNPCPTFAACRSSPRAFVSQMPFAPESTSTALCSPVPGAITWRSAWAGDASARSNAASIERSTSVMCPSSSGCSGETSTRNATESSARHGACARERRLSGQRALHSRRHPEAGAVEKLPAPRARGTYSCAPCRGPLLDDAGRHATSLALGRAPHAAEQGDAMHARRRLRFGLGIVTALAGALLAAAAAHATPTAITFSIEHADCAGAGVNGFALYLNDTLLATVPSTQGCTCNASPLVASFTDAATLALFDPAACNSFRADVTGGGQGVALG